MVITNTRKTAGSCLMEYKKELHWLNSFAIKNNKGMVAIEKGYACFASWGVRYSEIRGTITEIYLGVTQAEKYKEGISESLLPLYKKYLKFLLNTSIFKDIFITKRVSDAFRYGIKMNIDAPANQVQAAMTAVRRGWEFPEKLKVWGMLVKQGIAPSFAMGLSDHITPYGGNFNFNTSGSCSGHEAFCFLDVDKLITGILSPLRAITVPYNKNPKPEFKIFATTQQKVDKEYVTKNTFVMDEEASAEASKNNFRKMYILNLPETIINLLRIQKEHNVP